MAGGNVNWLRHFGEEFVSFLQSETYGFYMTQQSSFYALTQEN
jgi:hypothetical protein